MISITELERTLHLEIFVKGTWKILWCAQFVIRATSGSSKIPVIWLSIEHCLTMTWLYPFLSSWVYGLSSFLSFGSATLQHLPTGNFIYVDDMLIISHHTYVDDILLSRWGSYQYDPEEEHPRPEYLAQLETVKTKTINFVTKTTEPRPHFWTMKVPRFLLSWTVLAVLVSIACISVMSVILYRFGCSLSFLISKWLSSNKFRMSMIVALSALENNTIKGFQSLTISITGAAINLVMILVLNFVYNKVAIWLTDKELHRYHSSIFFLPHWKTFQNTNRLW